MKLLYDDKPSLETLVQLIDNNVVGDYVYMYPPRQAYSSLDINQAYSLVSESITKFQDLNLYFHVPFCKQICSFCNLFTKISTSKEEYEKYINLLITEIGFYKNLVVDKNIKSLYIGGGTPSLLDPSHISKLFNYISNSLQIDIFKIPEVALEVAPDTVEEFKFSHFKELGINRINLGFQTLNQSELTSIGRKHDIDLLYKSIQIIKKINFDNTCIDLIYGLQNQSYSDWVNSLKIVLEYQPETICIYPLTLRPATRYHKLGYSELSGEEQYRKYDIALDMLTSHGYIQETHIRFIKDKGGYLQKANHWKLENILGMGAGARSYLWFCDTRNSYGAVKRNSAYQHYVDCVENNNLPITDGFIMDEQERMRKALILNLINLDRQWFKLLFHLDVLEVFPILYNLCENGFVIIEKSKIMLTFQGLRYRDLIVQLFFGNNVRSKILSYFYED